MKIIRMLLPNQQSVDYSLEAMLHLNAVQGAAYSVVDLETGLVVEQAVLTRQADTLVIEIDGEQVATVEQFYAQGMAASVDTGSQAQQMAANDAVAESADLVWEHAADAGAVADGGFFSAPLLLFGGIAAGGLYSVNKDDAAAVVIPLLIDTSVVVFDLVEGVSSSHSNRTFDPNVKYTIYIRVQTDSHVLSTDGADADSAAADAGATWAMWVGVSHLGVDDAVVLVGTSSTPGDTPHSNVGAVVTRDGSAGGSRYGWLGFNGLAAIVSESGMFTRVRGGAAGTVDLWAGVSGSAATVGYWAAVPAGQVQTAGTFNALNTMPAGMLSSQGLA
ncbi:MAG: hypothetical protein ACJAWL_001782 [Motiliproteus sp.]|jgi:hypothetical protein